MKIDGFGSHLPILLWAINATGGPVDPATPASVRYEFPRALEIGTGWYSTAVIQSIGGESVETEEPFADYIRQFYPGVVHVSKWVPDRWYRFAFVDAAEHEHRSRWVSTLSELTDLVLVHDAEAQWWESLGYEEMTHYFPYWKVWEGAAPRTLILSNDPIDNLPESVTVPALW
jgi:hypothetical protein